MLRTCGVQTTVQIPSGSKNRSKIQLAVEYVLADTNFGAK